MTATLDTTPIHVPGDKEFWVEVLNDDDTYGLVVARFDRFDDALALYDRLTRNSLMRVIMRQRAHVFRNYIPERLHNSYDRSREYPC